MATNVITSSRCSDTESGFNSSFTSTTSSTSGIKSSDLFTIKVPLTKIRFEDLEGNTVRLQEQEENTLDNLSIDKYKLSHIVDCKDSNREIYEKLSGVIVSREDTTAVMRLELKQMSDENMETRIQKICQEIKDFCQQHLTAVEHEMEKQKWDFGKLKMDRYISCMGNSSRVSVFHDSKIVVVGKEKDITDFENGILSAVLSDKISKQTLQLDTDTVVICQLLDYERKLKFKFSLEIEINESESTMEVYGLQEDVLALEIDITKTLKNYYLTQIKLTEGQAAILTDRKVKKQMVAGLPKESKKCWRIDGGVFLAVRSSTNKSKETGLDLNLYEHEYLLTQSESEKLFKSSKWDQFKDLMSRNNEKVIANVENGKLTLTCTSTKRENVEMALECFRDENKIRQIKVPYKCTENVKKFCLEFKKNDILKMNETMADEFLEISVIDETGITVSGTDKSLQNCQKNLSLLMDDSQFTLSTFGISSEATKNMLTSESGRQIMQRVGIQHQCLIQAKPTVTILLKQGTIADEQADVLVNSVASEVSGSVGQSTVAHAIFEKGGPEFQQKLVEAAGGHIEHGNVLVTKKTGRLDCKEVFNACLFPDITDTKRVGEIVYDMVTKCMGMADGKRYKSIGFPALGTGTYKYHAEASAIATFNAILDFCNETESCSIENVLVITFPSAKNEVITAFVNEFKKREADSGSIFIEWNHRSITSGRLKVIAETDEAVRNAIVELQNEINRSRESL